jgi:hypothetical protein
VWRKAILPHKISNPHVYTPSSKFDHLPNSASTPKTHKTIVKYNMGKLGACRKFSGYIRENGDKFVREFQSFSNLMGM